MGQRTDNIPRVPSHGYTEANARAAVRCALDLLVDPSNMTAIDVEFLKGIIGAFHERENARARDEPYPILIHEAREAVYRTYKAVNAARRAGAPWPLDQRIQRIATEFTLTPITPLRATLEKLALSAEEIDTVSTRRAKGAVGGKPQGPRKAADVMLGRFLLSILDRHLRTQRTTAAVLAVEAGAQGAVPTRNEPVSEGFVRKQAKIGKDLLAKAPSADLTPLEQRLPHVMQFVDELYRGSQPPELDFFEIDS